MNFVSLFAQMLSSANNSVYELFIFSFFHALFAFIFTSCCCIIAQLALDSFFGRLAGLLNTFSLDWRLAVYLIYSIYVQKEFNQSL